MLNVRELKFKDRVAGLINDVLTATYGGNIEVDLSTADEGFFLEVKLFNGVYRKLSIITFDVFKEEMAAKQAEEVCGVDITHWDKSRQQDALAFSLVEMMKDIATNFYDKVISSISIVVFMDQLLEQVGELVELTGKKSEGQIAFDMERAEKFLAETYKDTRSQDFDLFRASFNASFRHDDERLKRYEDHDIAHMMKAISEDEYAVKDVMDDIKKKSVHTIKMLMEFIEHLPNKDKKNMTKVFSKIREAMASKEKMN